MENEKPKGNAMEKLATLIVDKRNLIFLLYIFALIFCVIATGWVNVENDITTYLPDSTETRQGLTVMNDNFTTYGTARVMVSNITYDKAVQLEEQLEDIDGVDSIDFDETSDHYKDSSALFSVSFDGEVDDPAPRPPWTRSAPSWPTTTPRSTPRSATILRQTCNPR